MPSRTRPGFLHLENGFAGQQGRGAGRDRDLDALFGGIADQFEDVRALQRVAAGEDEDGHLHVGDLVDQALAFGGGQLVGVGDGLGGGAAMLAGQVAGLRDFPDGQERSFVEVQPAAGGNVVHRLHGASSGIAANRPGRHRLRWGKGHDSVFRKAGRKAGSAVIQITYRA